MIINGSSNRCVWWWTQHLESEDNDTVRIADSYGLRSENIHGMLSEMEAMAAGTDCKNFFYQINMNPGPGEVLTEKEWDQARQIAEKKHGLEGQPYFMVMHVKYGREHPHFIYLRVDLETGRTISDSYDARKNHAIAREIERELGLQKVIGPYDREPGTPRPPRAPKKYEMYRDKQNGLDTRDITAEVTELRQQSQNGPEFKAALENHGYELVTGRRGLLILDTAGNEHSLARRCGITMKELNAFMHGVDRQALPTVEQGKAMHQDRKIAALEADRDTVKHEIEWEEKLAQAAVDKEKIEGRFIAPEDRQKEARGGRREKEPAQPPTKGAAVHIWNARERSDSPRAFAAALDQHGIALAAATQEEADRSRITAAYPKAIGNFAPEYRPGEIVAVTESGQVYQLNQRTTGKERAEMEAFLAQLDRSQLQGIEATKQSQQRRVNEKHWPTMPPQPEPVKTAPSLQFEDAARTMAQPEQAPSLPPNLKGPAAHIWIAYNIRIHMQERERKDLLGNIEKYQVPIPLKAGRDPYQFGRALEEKGMALARVTKDEAERSQREAAHWKIHGEWRPTHREGEFVAVTQRGDVYSLNQRTTGHDPKQVQSFLEKADWKGLSGIEGTKQIMQTRAEQRANERQAIRDEINAARMERATTINDRAPKRSPKNKAPAVVAKAPTRVLSGALNIGEKFLGGLFALLDPPTTPAQREQAAEKARDEREAQAERHIDFSTYTAERAQERQNQQEQQAARDRQREIERDR